MTARDGWRPCLLVMLMLLVAMAVVDVEARGGRRKVQGQRTQWRKRARLFRELKDLLMGYRTQDKASVPNYNSIEEGRNWMNETNRKMRLWTYRTTSADWNFVTNITNDTQAEYLSVVAEESKWLEPRVAEGRKFNVALFDDPDLQRQFQLFTLSCDPHDPDKIKKKSELHTTMMALYDIATVCLTPQNTQQQQQQQEQQSNHTRCLPLEPDLQNIMADSRDPAELEAVWEGWRDVAGKPQRQRYEQFVEILNEGARDNGFPDYSAYWTEEQFPDNTPLEAMASALWDELRPLYLELHAYVRWRLKQQYGKDIVGTDGTMPAHLLGNMWAQSWANIFSLVIPYPPKHGQASADIVDQLLKSQYDVHGLFKLSEAFYASMGLFNMTEKFWAKSMFVKPENREVQCHASAFDMYNPDDFRIKMCSSVTGEYLSVIHHEMGHVEYFMAYEHQPTVFRDSANQAFHEAVGDTTTLAVMSRTHLRKLGLVSDQSGDNETKDINDLMEMALAKIAFLPFALVVDRWRWQVFRGQTTSDTYNHDWWKLRLELQGLRSPVPRSEEDFDPAAKMHVPDNSPYYCYFISFVVQFQFYQSLCNTSGYEGPLHLCDFSGSLEAGARFKKFMALGASRPWPEALETLTGSRNISAQPMLKYFDPLLQWLKRKNEENGEVPGWENATINWQ